jgi:solute carrier family 35 protein
MCCRQNPPESLLCLLPQVAVHFLPAPTFVLICQLFVSAATVKVLDIFGVVHADKIEWDKLKKFAWVIVGFLGTIFCNIKVRKAVL